MIDRIVELFEILGIPLAVVFGGMGIIGIVLQNKIEAGEEKYTKGTETAEFFKYTVSLSCASVPGTSWIMTKTVVDGEVVRSFEKISN